MKEILRGARRALPYAIVTGGIRTFSGPIAAIILTHFILPQEYGALAAAMIVITLTNFLQAGGLKEYVVKLVPVTSEKKIFQICLLMLVASVVLWSIIILGRKELAEFLSVPGTSAILPILGVYLVLSPFISILTAFLEKKFRFRALTFVNAAGAIVPFALTIPLAIHGYGVWALVTGMIGERCVVVTLLLLLVRPQLEFKLSDIGATLYEMRSFMFGITAFQLLSWIWLNLDKTIISRELGTEVLGYYAFSITLVYLLCNLISEGVRPLVYSAVAKMQSNDSRLLGDGVRAMIAFMAPFAFFCVSAIFIFARFLSLILGEKWIVVADILPWLGLAIISTIVSLPFEAIKATGRVRFIILSHIIGLGIAIPLYYISVGDGLHTFSLSVGAIGVITTVIDILFISWALKYSPLKLLNALVRPMLVFGVVIAIGVVGVDLINHDHASVLYFIFGVPLFSIFYCVVTFIFDKEFLLVLFSLKIKGTGRV